MLAEQPLRVIGCAREYQRAVGAYRRGIDAMEATGSPHAYTIAMCITGIVPCVPQALCYVGCALRLKPDATHNRRLSISNFNSLQLCTLFDLQRPTIPLWKNLSLLC